VGRTLDRGSTPGLALVAARGSVRMSAAPASTPAPVVVELPESQQAAVDAAVQCLLPALQPLLVAVKPTKTAKVR
jgi:hypothetical protein